MVSVASTFPAVQITNAYKRYTPKSVVLQGLSMTVRDGSIYGLLGPSGCGKTTLLSCIVGRNTLDAGDIRVIVNRKERLGYMPQELSLNDEFTIFEILRFYGRIFNMEDDKIDERSKFLIDFLELPPGERGVTDCSGGQQRRISMAVTLIHNPELLILDEPTVGVDPILNEKIWDYFVKLSNEEQKTIIITTHYIEEAKHSHTIGLMRGGKLLAEESPQSLLAKYNTDSLEQVFLKLSEKQDNEEKELQNEITYPKRQKMMPTITDPYKFRSKRFLAQLNKNMKWAITNIDVTLFVILLIPIQLAICCTIFAEPPTGVNVGFTSQEIEPLCSPSLTMVHDMECLEQVPVSCRVMNKLKENYKLIEYKTEEEAKQGVIKGHTFGYLSFPTNFSKYLVERLIYQSDVGEEAIEYGTISVQLDQSSYALQFSLKRQIYLSLEHVLQDICKECDLPIKLASLPVDFHDPVYGKGQSYFRAYLGPYMNSLSFYATFMYTSAAMVMERSSGSLERMQIAGLTVIEILAAHMVLQTILMTFQNIFGFIVVYAGFANDVAGSYATAYFLVTLAQCLGIAYGFLVGILLPSLQLTAYAGIGSVLSLFFLCGVIWPMEGQSMLVRPLSEAIPITSLSRSYTNVANRGWSFWNIWVMDGVLQTLTVIGALIAASVVLLRLKIATF